MPRAWGSCGLSKGFSSLPNFGVALDQWSHDRPNLHLGRALLCCATSAHRNLWLCWQGLPRCGPSSASQEEREECHLWDLPSCGIRRDPRHHLCTSPPRRGTNAYDCNGCPQWLLLLGPAGLATGPLGPRADVQAPRPFVAEAGFRWLLAPRETLLVAQGFGQWVEGPLPDRPRPLPFLFAMDASLTCAGLVASDLLASVVKEFWRYSEQRGCYTSLQNPASAALSGLSSVPALLAALVPKCLCGLRSRRASSTMLRSCLRWVQLDPRACAVCFKAHPGADLPNSSGSFLDLSLAGSFHELAASALRQRRLYSIEPWLAFRRPTLVLWWPAWPRAAHQPRMAPQA